MFIIKLLSQRVSGIIMPIIRRTSVCTAAYGVLHWLWWLWLCGAAQLQCRTPYAAVHALVLLKMGIMMPETCWDKSFIINIRLVASCWFLSLHPAFMMHSHKSLKLNCLLLILGLLSNPNMVVVFWVFAQCGRWCKDPRGSNNRRENQQIYYPNMHLLTSIQNSGATFQTHTIYSSLL